MRATLVLTIAAAACGGASDSQIDAAPSDSTIQTFEVTSTSPTDQETGVERSVVIEAAFSRDVASATLDATTFVVLLGDTSIPGEITYDATSHVAVFRPTAELSLLAMYTATITTGVTDVDGTPLAEESSWTFTVRDRVWSAPELVQDEPGYLSDVQIAIDDAGNALAIWLRSAENGIYPTFASRYAAGVGWGTPMRLSGARHTESPSLAMEASGAATIAWEEDTGVSTAQSIWTRSYDPASGWSMAVRFVDNPSYITGVDVAPGLLAWSADSTGRPSIWVSRELPGSGWTPPELLETDDVNYAYRPLVAVDADGNAVVVWTTQLSGAQMSVWTNTFDLVAGWSGPTPLELYEDGPAGDPVLVVDASGVATVLWMQTSDSSLWSRQFARGIGWGTALPLETEMTDPIAPPSVTVAPSGVVTAMWEQPIDASHFPSLRVSQLVPGAAWASVPAPAVLVNSPQVSCDAEGNLVAVWAYGQATASHLPIGGVWTPPVTIGATGDLAAETQLAANASGDAVAIWQLSGAPGLWASVLR